MDKEPVAYDDLDEWCADERWDKATRSEWEEGAAYWEAQDRAARRSWTPSKVNLTSSQSAATQDEDMSEDEDVSKDDDINL